MKKLTLTILSETGDFSDSLHEIIKQVADESHNGWNENDMDCFKYVIEHVHNEEQEKKNFLTPCSPEIKN